MAGAYGTFLNDNTYSALFMSHPDAVYILDLEGNYCDANPTALRLSGFSLDEIRRLNFAQLVVQEDLEMKRKHFELCKNGATERYQITLLNKNNERMLVDVTNIPIVENNEVVGIYGISRDLTPLVTALTERRHLEEGLYSVEQELLDTLENQQGMTFKYRKTGNKFIHTRCAGKLLYLLGFEAGEIDGKELKEFMPAEMAEIKEQYYERAWQGEENVTYEGTLGDITYMASLSPIKKNNEIVEVVASCIDITELKKTEESLISVKHQLESFIESHADPIVIYDKNGAATKVNPAFEKLLGWTSDEVLGLDLPNLRFIPEHLKDEICNLVEQIKKGKAVKEFETIRRNKKGNLLDVILTLSPIYNGKGVLDGWSVILRDITERKRTEELLLKSEKLTMVGQLAAGIGHEIRNPLTTLKGFLQLMAKGENSYRPYLDVMRSELERIELITGELLLLAKPQMTQYKQTNVLDVVHEVITLLEPQANMNNIQFEVFSSSVAPVIQCDSNQIKQVYINFIKNSIEAMTGGGLITIQVKIDERKQAVKTVFIDQGCGIPEDQIKKLGEPFYTTKENGTGLGMLVSYKIIENHQGSLFISSEVNVGTRIEVSFPLYSGAREV